ncbi:hypothetical protein MmiEs2_16310 [Methanimicrococcus stummii]|uniref:Insecticide toxin TcdB middle/N-terminal domain-containing protein n=1 Tax=Methanimicrococcus stummii TaxID=3028294 RepID=A0AA96ZXV4_9EURY|nr:FG-GAP-like repeat-containing protein [Methanimicrococcus sp. Es2]WNY29404.1 hypothetical protein MmiEs2_16310 [Methanimicrococcus sp. Es2]
MDLKKVFVLLIVLMILTPSFAFAIESESIEMNNKNSAEMDSASLEESQKTQTNESLLDFEPSTDEMENNETAMEEMIEETENEEEIQIMAAAADDPPGINIDALTAQQIPETGMANDSYLTSNFSGAAVYMYPIQIPKGIVDFQPSIKLIYNSQSAGGTYGWLGDGWSLNEYYIGRDVNYTPSDTSDDKFRLFFDGKNHDLIFNEIDGTYHTEIETYMDIRKVESGENQQEEYWTIKTKDGVEYRFGYNDDSELLNSISTRNYVTKWKLDQIKDNNGNIISYQYIENPIDGEIGTSYLSSIIYNEGLNTIEFERMQKAIVFDNYKNGTHTSEKSLLSSIIIKANDDEIYRYNIQYETADNHISLKTISLTDGMETLPETSFTYGKWAGTYSRDTSWNIPMNFIHNDVSYKRMRNVDQGANFVDVNGDGYPDIVQCFMNNHAITKGVWINDGTKFVKDSYRSQNLANQTYFNNYYNGHIYPSGSRIIDLNGDGLPDIISATYDKNYGYRSSVWINTGNEFVGDSTWKLPSINLANNSGVRIADLNGDGLPDIVESGYVNSRYSKAWLNTGSGFVYNSTWEPPILFNNNSGAAFVDINGDGLPDIVESYAQSGVIYKKTYINTGEGFVLDQTNQLPVILSAKYGDSGTRFADFNGDGLNDIIISNPIGNSSYINRGKGFSKIQKNVPFHFVVTDFSLNSGARVTDINADGLPDVVRSSYIRDGGGSFNHVWINSPSDTPNLLKQISHASGSQTKIEYDVSTHYDNRDENGNHRMPIPINVVKKIEIENGMDDEKQTKSIFSYDYLGGVMHIEPKGKSEFLGFRKVTIDDGKTITEHHFHQDLAKKGNEYLTVIKSTENNLYSETENTFESYESNGIFEVLLKKTKTSLFDGEENPIVSVIDYEYDEYGNTLQIFNKGDVQITGDERKVQYEYTYNINKRILDKISKKTLEDENGIKISETKYYYDEASDLNIPPSKGLVTRIENWNSFGEDLIQKFEYDLNGNPILQIDANGHTTAQEFEDNPIYPTSITNALGQKTLLDYDYRIGKPIKITDPNGYETFNEYDNFGRIIKIIKSGDSTESPTIHYQYFIDGTAPECIQTSIKEKDNQYYDTWKYYDGLKRVIKTESESENPAENIIQETYYNDFGNVFKVVAPRKSFEPYLNTTSEYDSFGRLIQITNPDGTSKDVEYEQLKTTTFDERGNKIQSDQDVYGNIVKVTEFNGNEIYETGYEYNAANKLTKIIPNQYYDQSNISFLTENENEIVEGLENTTSFEMNLSSLGFDTPIDTTYKVGNITFAYDSLGQLVKLDDPDLGIWTYEYNANGKKASETDNRGVKTYYDYDPLDRIILIDYPNDSDVVFEYDNGTVGTLSRVTTGITTKSYLYDERLRVVEENVSILESGNIINEIPITFVDQSNAPMQQIPENAYSENNIETTQLLKVSESGTFNLDKMIESAKLADYDEVVNIPASIENQTESLFYDKQYDETYSKTVLPEESRKVIQTISPVNSVGNDLQGGESVNGSFSRVEDIILDFENENYYVKEFHLDNLDVSMSEDDVAYIQINGHEIMRFIDSSAGGTLLIFDDQGTLLDRIEVVNGNAQSVRFNVSLIFNESNMAIHIQKNYQRQITEYYYTYYTKEPIITFRTYIDGYESNRNFINGKYRANFETKNISEQMIFPLVNEEDFVIHQNNNKIKTLNLTNLRVSTSSHDIAAFALNDKEILRFIDTSEGGQLQIFDFDGNQLGEINQTNGHFLQEDETFNISFKDNTANLLIEIEKLGNDPEYYTYVCELKKPIIYARGSMFGYQSDINYISGEYDVAYEAVSDPVKGFFEYDENVTFNLYKEGYAVQEINLININAHMVGREDEIIFYLNDNPALILFNNTSLRNRFFSLDENGLVQRYFGIRSSNDIVTTVDVSFVRNDENMLVSIQPFTLGRAEDLTHYNYGPPNDITEIKITARGYESEMDDISSIYNVKYRPIISEVTEPVFDENEFKNEQHIATHIGNEEFYANELHLTDFRATLNKNSNASIYLNDYEIIKFSDEDRLGSISLFNKTGSQIGLIPEINFNTSYENITYDIIFSTNSSELTVDIEQYEKGISYQNYSYCFEFDETIVNSTIGVENYNSGKYYVDGRLEAFQIEPRDIDSNFITQYQYDSMDRIIQKTQPNGEIIEYQYNNQALLSSIPGIIDNINYNSMNLMTRKDFTNGISTDLTYDDWTQRIENINTPNLQNLDYSFDEKGNIIGISDNILNENQYFFYDDLDRLLLAGSENYAQSFSYNPIGSILAHRSKDLTTGDEIVFGFEYGNNAGIHAPTRVADMELFYDANGNLIEDAEFVYIYNDANRLTEVLKKSENNQTIAEFIYDESGNRIKKIENGVVSYYISEDFDIEDGEETVYYFANGNRVAKNSTEGTFWYLDDHLGSTNVMIDEAGELVERTLYYPFGSHREGGEEKYSFTGKEFDSEIGLYYYGARYYNPETFVFTQADTMIPDVYNPQALNRYSYCYNNPLKYEDPDGHVPFLATALLGAGIGLVIGGTVAAYKQYQATGTISDWQDVAKGAAIGGITGGLIGLTCGAGAAIVGGGVASSTTTTAAAIIIDSHIGAGISVGVGVFERSVDEIANGGKMTGVLEAGLEGDALLGDVTTGAIPTPPTGNKNIDVGINVVSSQTSKELTKNTSTVQTVKDGGAWVKKAISPAQTSLKNGSASFKNYVNSKTNSWKQKLKSRK